MNPEITFLRQKSTGIKFVSVQGRAGIAPVTDLPHCTGSDSWLRDVNVKCESCEAWHKACTMHAVKTGLVCSACFTPSAPVDERAAAMEKAAKLLRLAQSDNPNEAALAAARAQEIIDRYKLNAAALASEAEGTTAEEAEEIRNYEDDPLSYESRKVTWKIVLAMALAEANQCMAYTHGADICIIGRPSDVAIVRPFFTHLTGEIDRLTEKHCKGNGQTYRNNFRLGAVDTIGRRLKAAQAATVEAVKAEALQSGGESALVLVESSLAILKERRVAVDTWSKQNMRLRNYKFSQTNRDERAREAGRRAGESISLERSSGALPSSRPALH